MTVDIEVVPLDKPDDVNVIVGQSHFIKTVEDLHEALAGVGRRIRCRSSSQSPTRAAAWPE